VKLFKKISKQKMASKPVKDLAEVARLQNLLFANHLVLRAKRAPHRLVPVDYETAESLREHLDDDVWEEYVLRQSVLYG
jgi:hypothetical protein